MFELLRARRRKSEHMEMLEEHNAALTKALVDAQLMLTQRDADVAMLQRENDALRAPTFSKWSESVK